MKEKYMICREIGSGGMAKVYLVIEEETKRRWALKEISKEVGTREMILLKQLEHPALPEIEKVWETEKTYCILMEYIEGQTLEQVVEKQGPVEEETVLIWSIQLAEVLLYLHTQNPPIIFRDMKPSNVIVKSNGDLKLIDFGIAGEYRIRRRTEEKVLGTRGYAPVEQYGGWSDWRTDIYSLGMTMHYLLTGVAPGKDNYKPVRKWNAKISKEIEKVIDKCVQTAAENRYQNCGDLLYDLWKIEKIKSKKTRNKWQRKFGR